MTRPRDPKLDPDERFSTLVDVRPALKRATATITCTAKANYIDGENGAVIKDGYGNTYTVEMDVAGDGVTAGSIQADISGDTTDADVASTIETALNADAGFAQTFTVSRAAEVLTLTRNEAGDLGNIAITENVADAGHVVAGFTGGQDRVFNATATVKLFTAQRDIRLEKVELNMPDGFTEHASNFWDIQVKRDATVAAVYSTDSAAEGTITADTPTDVPLHATDANRVIAKDEVVAYALTKNASAADLPAFQLRLEGRYV